MPSDNLAGSSLLCCLRRHHLHLRHSARYARTIRATSIRAITIMTNAVEVNRIWLSQIPNCGERFL
jgi:hypothetical protein